MKTIWLADDDPDDLKIFEEFLKEVDSTAHLTTFQNGYDLLNSLSAGPPPDLLFLDLNMPLDGYTCLSRIRENEAHRSLPIIVFSSSFRDSDVQTSYVFGAQLYIRKPSMYTEMLSLIKAVLELDWSQPEKITSHQLVNGRYIPFTAPARE